MKNRPGKMGPLGAILLAMGTVWMVAQSKAVAQDLVFYEGEDADVAVARVVIATGQKTASLSPTDFDAVSASMAPTVGGMGAFDACAGDSTTSAEIEGLIEKVDSAISFMEHDSARKLMRQIDAKLGCLSEPLLPSLGARGPYLGGIVALADDNKPEAWAHFNQAALLDPDIKWDENFAPEGKALFKGARTETISADGVEVFLLPPPVDGALRIDGKPIAAGTEVVELKAGRHLVQWAGAGAVVGWLSVEPGPASSFMVPSLMPENTLLWARREKGQARLAQVLGALGVGSDTAYVTASGGVWKYTATDGKWETIVEAEVSSDVPVPPETDVQNKALADAVEEPEVIRPSSGRTSTARILKNVGLGVSAVGGVYSAVFYQKGLAAVREAEQATTVDTYNAAINDYNNAGPQLMIGEGIVLVGLATTGVSLMLQSSEWRPVLGMGQLGVAGTW